MKTNLTILSAAACLMMASCARPVSHEVIPGDEYPEIPAIKPNTPIRPSMTVRLYPEGQAAGKGISENGVEITPGATVDNGLRGEEKCTETGSRSNIGDEARMDIYIPENNNGIMILDTPGGGYSIVATFHEGAYAADFLTRKGFCVCVLKYRLPNRHPEVPLEDVHNAMRYLRYHAADWGLSTIGIMGGSAGGHLSACAAVMWTDSLTRPDFSVQLYPRIPLNLGESNGSRDNLIGTDEQWADNMDEYARLLERWSPDNFVTSDTPPTFIALSDDDPLVNRSYIPFYLKLSECKVPLELHVFATGGHGWSFETNEFRTKGKDKFEKYRPVFETALVRWLLDQKKE